MDYASRFTRKIDNEWYIGLLVALSLVLQMLLYLAAPLREKTRSKSILGLTSIIFSLSNWIPAFTLILICSRAVFGYDCDTTGHEPPLLAWSSIMLLHLGGHGQERETPLSLQQGEIFKESCKVILEFLFYSMLLVISFIFLVKSWSDLAMPAVTLTFVLLACARTFAKLKHLQGKRNEIKQDMSRYDASKYSYLKFFPVEFELHFIYHKLYGMIILSKFELILFPIIVLLSTPYPFTLHFIVALFVNSYGFPYGLSFSKGPLRFSLTITSLLAAAYSFSPFVKEICTHFYDRPDLIWPLTHQLVVYPIMLRHHFSHRRRHDYSLPPRWSRTIPRFNLLEYSIQRPSKLSSSVDYMLNTWPLSGKEDYTAEIGEFICNELKRMILEITDDHCGKAGNLFAVRQIISAEGLWVLKQNKLQKLVDFDAPFGERVLHWHIATGILYYTDSTNGDRSSADNSYMSMLLSDYMGYLLIVQPWIMSKQRGAVFRRCIEMWENIYKFTVDYSRVQKRVENKEMCLRRLCEEIMLRQWEDQNKSVLQGASALAQKLESTFSDANKKWSIIVKVWVEMLTYASIRCSPVDHIHGLSQGGELSTIIRLWMARLGVLETVCKSMPQSSSFKSQVQMFNMGVNPCTLSRTMIEVTKANKKQEESLDEDELWPYYTGSIFKVEDLLGSDYYGKDEELSQLDYTGMISNIENKEKLWQDRSTIYKDLLLPDQIEKDQLWKDQTRKYKKSLRTHKVRKKLWQEHTSKGKESLQPYFTRTVSNDNDLLWPDQTGKEEKGQNDTKNNEIQSVHWMDLEFGPMKKYKSKESKEVQP